MSFLRIPEFRQKLPESMAGQIDPNEISKLLLGKIPHAVKYNFSVHSLTIKTIMGIITDGDDIKNKLTEYDNFDILNPTDFSRPNFITSTFNINKKIANNEYSEIELKRVTGRQLKSVNPLRLSIEEAYYIEELTRKFRYDMLINSGVKYTDDQMRMESAIFMSILSPEAYAAFFFYHDKFSSTGVTFNPKDVAIHPFQKALLTCNNNTIAALISRQIGKTTALQILITWYLFFRDGFRAFYIAQKADSIQKFTSELYSEDGTTKIHPYITDVYGDLRKATNEFNLVYKRRLGGSNEFVSGDSRIYMAYAKGSHRFVGQTVQAMFMDEIATYDIDPTPLAGPMLNSYGSNAFTIYTTTQREEGNPFIPIMNRSDIRLFQRNIWSAFHTGYQDIADVNKGKSECSGEPIRWETEYECMVPNSGTGELTLNNIRSAASIIDQKIESDVWMNGGSDLKPWELRDERLFDYYTLKSFSIGTDWNGVEKGNNIYVVATVVDKDDDPTKASEYKYVIYDSYKIRGELYAYNTAVIMNTLIDKYNVPMIYCDRGFSLTISQIYATHQELHVTQMGTRVYDPNAADHFPAIQFISFQTVIKRDKIDNFDVSHDNKVYLREASINTIIEMIKQQKLLFSKYESKFIEMAPVIEMAEDDENYKMMANRYSGTRCYRLSNTLYKYDIGKTNTSNYLEPLIFAEDETTFIDELRKLKFDEKKGKYVASKMVKGLKIEDDDLIALSSAMYPAWSKYESFYLEGISKFEDTIKTTKTEQNAQNLAEGLAGLKLYGSHFI